MNQFFKHNYSFAIGNCIIKQSIIAVSFKYTTVSDATEGLIECGLGQKCTSTRKVVSIGTQVDLSATDQLRMKIEKLELMVVEKDRELRMQQKGEYIYTSFIYFM